MTEAELIRRDGHENRNRKAREILQLAGRVATMLYDFTPRAEIARQLGVRKEWVLRCARFLKYPDGKAGRK